MALTVDIYKSGIKLGAGSATGGSASVTSYTGTAPGKGRNVTAHITQAGTHAGRHWRTRIVTDGGTTLTLAAACPFIE